MKIIMNEPQNVPSFRLLEAGKAYDVPSELGNRLVVTGKARAPAKPKPSPKGKEGNK